MDKLNLISTFLHTARLGSFVASASYLGVDPSTVSKSIQQLETHLGLKLFNRTTRSIKLTPAGIRYRETCRHIVDTLDACEQQLRQQHNEVKGLLRINLPVAYGQCYIMPIVSRFRERYPDVELDISLSDDYIDMVNSSIDIAIRSGKLEDSRLVAKKLTPMDFAICAAPSYLQQAGPITHSTIEQHPWLSYRFSHTGQLMPVFGIRGNKKQKTIYQYEPKPVLTTTDGLAMIISAEAGAGLVQAPHFLLRDAISTGRLKVVQSYYRSSKFNVYAYFLNKHFIPAKVSAFIQFLSQELEQQGETHQQTYLSQQGWVLLDE